MTPHNRPTLGQDEADAALRVLASGWLAQGAEVAGLEHDMCAFLGLPHGHAVAVSSGSAALYLALLGADARGKVVGAPGYSCRSLWNAIELAGASASWQDCAAEASNVAGATIAATDAPVVIAAHMFGIPIRLAGAGNQFIIEDCAQSVGAMVDGAAVGTQAAVAVFSFGATKPFTSGGQGGMLVARDAALAQFLREARDYDTVPDSRLRFNFQMTDLQAAIGRVQLRRLPAFLERRKAIFKYYQSAGLALLDSSDPGIAPSHFRAVLHTSNGPALQTVLAAASIRAIVPITLEELQAPVAQLPHAAQLCRSTLSLPLYPSLTDAEVEAIARICAEHT